MTLTLKTEIPLRLDVSGVTPTALMGLNDHAIGEIPVRLGSESVSLGEFFRVGGDLSDGSLIWEGNLGRVDSIGEGLSEGTILSRGPVGRYAGRQMTGGVITIQGSTGPGAGLSMRGGRLLIEGDTGDDLGGIEPGRKVGMQGGVILVNGKAGDHVGRQMRRGTIAVRGDCGNGVMMDAIAGTVFVFGTVAERPGAGMRRGTLFLLGSDEPSILPTFKRGRDIEPLFGRLLVRDLIDNGFPVEERFLHPVYRVYHGDLLTLGLGEILVPER
jgi:formylmethanofuran dehydrogenase subunit C